MRAEISGRPKNVYSIYDKMRRQQKEFDEIYGRLKSENITYGSGPNAPANGEINTRRGGRGLYFVDPDGHLMEIMTTPE